jgi:LacI family transcriptional regulator
MVSERRPARTGFTLKQLAEVAGVHPSTVSRALDPLKNGLVAADVADRIRRIAEEYGYRRNSVAASLRTQRSTLVGVLVPDIANPVFSPIISGITEVVRGQGFSTIVADTGGEADSGLRLVDELIARRVEGLVLASATRNDPVLNHCLAEGIPVVLVNRADDLDRAPAVVSDDILGMRAAVEHLYGLGHREIGFVGGPERLSTGHLRRIGFEKGLSDFGFAFRPDLAVEARAYDIEAGQSAAADLMRRHPRLTAIVAGNDLLALGTCAAIRGRGLTCPGDVSVVGHNDMPLVDLVEPSLTTIRIGPRQMGQEAARMLLALIDGEAVLQMRVVLPSTLIVRGSTGAPNKAAQRR